MQPEPFSSVFSLLSSHFSSRGRQILIGAGALAVWCAGSLQAQTTATWNGGSGNWHTAGNWSPGIVPNDATRQVLLDNGNGTASLVTLDSDATIGRLTVDAGDTLSIGNGRWLTVQAGSFAGSGTVLLNGMMTFQPGGALRLSSSTPHAFQLSGAGMLNLGSNGTIFVSGSGHSLVSGVTITGSGTITPDMVNNGTIQATGASGITLNMANFTNNGSVLASSGFKVNFSGAGTILNSGQVMTADGTGSQLLFNSGSTIRGGTLRGINGGEVLLYNDNLVLDGETSGAITLEGLTRIQPNYYPYIRGSIINNGTIETGPSSALRIAANQSATLGTAGGGQLTINSASVGGFSGSQFTNGTGHTISGNGTIYVDTINNGTISASGVNGLTLSMSNFTNNGTVVASAGSKVTFSGTGTIQNAGQYMTADGAGAQLIFISGSTLQAGTLRGINGGEVLLYNDNLVLDGETSGAVWLEGLTRIQPNYYPYIRGDIVNNGTIQADTSSALRIAAGQSATLHTAGAGQLLMNSASISGSTGSQFTHNYGHTISGHGTISVNTSNYGTISATGASGLNLSMANFTNHGTVVANAGSKITFNGGTILNEGQVITADGAGSQLYFASNSTVRGGTFRGINGGEVLLFNDNLVLDGQTNGAITLEGQTRIQANYYPYIRGSIINNGTITTGTSSLFRIASGQSASIGTASGTGEMVLNNAHIWGYGGGSSFTNGRGHTIRGTGTIGGGGLNLVNEGTIGGGSGTLTISPAATFVNQGHYGRVRATDGGIVNFTSGSISNNSTWGFEAEAGSSINLTGSAVLTNYSAGTLTGGRYAVHDSGQLNLGIGGVSTLDGASVYLKGATASFAPVNLLATITNSGHFGITDGRNFSTAAGLAISNYGSVRVGNGSTLTVSGMLNNAGKVFVDAGGTLLATGAPVPQYVAATNTLHGNWHVGGTLRMDIGDVHRLGGSLVFEGPGGKLEKANGTFAVNLMRIESGAELRVQGDSLLIQTLGAIENHGQVYLGNGASTGYLQLAGDYIQQAGSTRLDQGNILASGNILINNGSLLGHGQLVPGGTTPTVSVNGLINPMQAVGWFGTGAGTLDIAGRLGLTTGSTYSWTLDVLADNSLGIAGADWDLITTDLDVFGGNVELALAEWNVLDPNTSHAFWESDHQWDILKTDAGAITAWFYLNNPNYVMGTFSLGTVTNGGSSTLRLYFNSYSVPEPSAAVLAAMGLVLLAAVRRRRRGDSAGPA